MPRQSKKQCKKGSPDGSIACAPGNEDLPDSPMAKYAKTEESRGLNFDEDEEPQDFGNEMQKMLECFGADISKTLSGKRRRLEQFTQSTLKTNTKRVEDAWQLQQADRKKLADEFQKQINGVLQQWDTDLEKSNDQEEKVLSFMRQQQKMFQQARSGHSQRLKCIKQLFEQYCKGMENLEKFHLNQKLQVQADMKKEMGLLQKKILMDTQQQEMASFKKSLQTMLL